MVALFLLVGACAVDVRSQQPPRPPDSNPENSQDQSTDEIAKELRSIAIELRAANNQQREQEADRAKRETNDIEWSNWVTQLPLLILAGISAWGVRRAFYLTHRPLIVVRNVVFDELGLEMKKGSIWLSNTGESRAIVLKVWHTLIFEKHLPMKNPGNDATIPDMPPLHIDAGRAKPVTLNDVQVDDLEKFRTVFHRDNGMHLYLIGWVKYKDAIGTFRRTNFCRQYDPTDKRFRVVQDPDYEYAD